MPAEALEDLRTVIGVLRDGPDELRPTPGLPDLAALVEQERAAGPVVTLDVADVGPAVAPRARRVPDLPGRADQRAPARAGGAGRRAGVRATTGCASAWSTAPAVAGLGAGTGTGLVGLTERIELLGGTLRAAPTAGGFALDAWLPWDP